MKWKNDVQFLMENKAEWENKTPCFVINQEKLNNNIENLKKYLQGEIAYSHKTNPDDCVIKNVLNNGCSLLISSIEELGEVVKLNNFSAKNIIFQSPSLTEEQYKITRKIGVHRYSIDSLDQLEIFLNDIENNRAELELLVRINTGVKIKNPELPYGMDSYLGFPLEEAEKIIIKLNSLRDKGVKKVGLHNHLLSQNTHLDIWKENLDTMFDFLEKLNAGDIMVDMLDFGGGYPVEYHEAVPDLSEIGGLISEMQGKVGKIYPNMEYIFEPGRKLIGEAVSLVAKVVHIKNFFSENVAILNCSLYNCSMDTLIVDLYLPVKKVQDKESAELKQYVIRGSTPDSLDIFSKGIELPQLEKGDFLAFLNCGAYSFGSEFISLRKAECIGI